MTESSHSLPDKSFLLSRKIFLVLIAIIDLALVVFCDLAAFTLRFGTDINNPPPVNFLAYLQIAQLILILRFICFYTYGLYENIKSKTLFNIIVSVMQATTASSIIVIISAFYFRATAYPRTVILISWILASISLTLWHTIIQLLIDKLWHTANNNLLIIGTDSQAKRAGLHFSKDATTKYKILGFLSPDKESSERDPNITDMLQGSIKDLPAIIQKHTIDEIIIATEDLSRAQISSIFNSLRGKSTLVKLLPDIYDAVLGNVILSTTASSRDLSGILISPTQSTNNWYRRFKRILDIFFSLLMLSTLSPLIIIVAILIKITSPGPIVFRQKRLGVNGRIFTMYKFRTMHKDAEEESGPVWTSPKDLRITPLGRFLRLSHIDELPQLLNVLKNDMSIVGPRPERQYFVEKLIEEIPFYAERLTFKPGITGWAQVTCNYADSLEDSKEKLLHDIFYIKNMSPSLDALVFIKTLLTLIREKGAQ